MRLVHLFFYITSVIILSCTDKTSSSSEETTESLQDTVVDAMDVSMSKKNLDLYFTANGTEPFWNLSISEDMIKLRTMEDSIMTPYSPPILAQDSNVKRYNLSTERVDMTIQISYVECINAMSGEGFPYSVFIRYKYSREEEFNELKGCGIYHTDSRLNGIWELEMMNGNRVSTDDFNKEVPNLEIRSEDNDFSGYAGCNRTRGNLFYENNVLRFTNVISTKMLCQPNNKEDQFLKALESSTSYKFNNDNLVLFNPDGELLVFNRIN